MNNGRIQNELTVTSKRIERMFMFANDSIDHPRVRKDIDDFIECLQHRARYFFPLVEEIPAIQLKQDKDLISKVKKEEYGEVKLREVVPKDEKNPDIKKGDSEEHKRAEKNRSVKLDDVPTWLASISDGKV